MKLTNQVLFHSRAGCQVATCQGSSATLSGGKSNLQSDKNPRAYYVEEDTLRNNYKVLVLVFPSSRLEIESQLVKIAYIPIWILILFLIN